MRRPDREGQHGGAKWASSGGFRKRPPRDIATLRNDAEQKAYERVLHPGILDLWTINGSLNIAGAKGNAETSTLTTPFNFVRASTTSRTTPYFNSLRSRPTIGDVRRQHSQAV